MVLNSAHQHPLACYACAQCLAPRTNLALIFIYALTHSSAQPRAQKMVLIGLFRIRTGLSRRARQAVRAVEEAKNEAVNARKFLTEQAWPDVQKDLEDAKNEAVNARKFLTEEAWPDVQKTLEEMRDTVAFTARMMVLLVALCVCIYVTLKLRELILSSGVPAFVKTIVNWMCLSFFLVVFTTIFVIIFHLFLEMDLYDYIVVFIKEFWDIYM